MPFDHWVSLFLSVYLFFDLQYLVRNMHLSFDLCLVDLYVLRLFIDVASIYLLVHPASLWLWLKVLGQLVASCKGYEIVKVGKSNLDSKIIDL